MQSVNGFLGYTGRSEDNRTRRSAPFMLWWLLNATLSFRVSTSHYTHWQCMRVLDPYSLTHISCYLSKKCFLMCFSLIWTPLKPRKAENLFSEMFIGYLYFLFCKLLFHIFFSRDCNFSRRAKNARFPPPWKVLILKNSGN